jgi:hypothetical protein
VDALGNEARWLTKHLTWLTITLGRLSISLRRLTCWKLTIALRWLSITLRMALRWLTEALRCSHWNLHISIALNELRLLLFKWGLSGTHWLSIILLVTMWCWIAYGHLRSVYIILRSSGGLVLLWRDQILFLIEDWGCDAHELVLFFQFFVIVCYI